MIRHVEYIEAGVWDANGTQKTQLCIPLPAYGVRNALVFLGQWALDRWLGGAQGVYWLHRTERRREVKHAGDTDSQATPGQRANGQ